MPKTKAATGEVWGVQGGKLHLFTGVRVGASMITFPGGQRWARDGRGMDGYYATELEAAAGMIADARWKAQYHRERMVSAESIVADCERVLGTVRPASAPSAVDEVCVEYFVVIGQWEDFEEEVGTASTKDGADLIVATWDKAKGEPDYGFTIERRTLVGVTLSNDPQAPRQPGGAPGRCLPDDVCVELYDAVTRSNLTRDVKTSERKVAVVTETLAKFGGGK